MGDVEALGGVGGDGDRLDEELVFAAGVEGRVLLHGLQEDLDLHGARGLDATRVWAHAVPGRIGLDVVGDCYLGQGGNILLGRSGLDLERNGVIGRVGQAQDLGDLMGEGTWVICQLGEWQAGCMAW